MEVEVLVLVETTQVEVAVLHVACHPRSLA